MQDIPRKYGKISTKVVHIGGTVRTYNPFFFSALHADVDALDLLVRY